MMSTALEEGRFPSFTPDEMPGCGEEPVEAMPVPDFTYFSGVGELGRRWIRHLKCHTRHIGILFKEWNSKWDLVEWKAA